MKIVNGIKFYPFYLTDAMLASVVEALKKRPLEESIDAFLQIQNDIAENRKALQPPPLAKPAHEPKPQPAAGNGSQPLTPDPGLS